MSDRRFDYHMWASMTRFIRAAANDHTDSSLAEFGIVGVSLMVSSSKTS